MTLIPTKPLMLSKADVLGVPAWTAQALGVCPARINACREPVALFVSADGAWSLARAVIEDADNLDDKAMRQATAQAYRGVLHHLAESVAPYPVRAWNAVPSITRSGTPGKDRYMAFNAGRHDAYTMHFADCEMLASTMPTASAIGHDGPDLIISVLGCRQPGRAIENPRQIPAFRYSARYGKTPPSFVRAMVLSPEAAGVDETRVLVAGTASVVGEDSKHSSDLQSQLGETFRNLAAIVAAACLPPRDTERLPQVDPPAWLACYQYARVYVRKPDDFKLVMQSVSAALPSVCDLEFVRADICRPELLIEIEGVATLPNTQAFP